MSQLEVDKIIPQSGTTLTLGDTGDTINFGSGVLPNFENLTVTGDLTVDTNSLKVDSANNRVGIGTASPSVALDVVGAITASGNITGTLATAAQPNITSVGTLTSFASTGIDDNATSTAITIDSSQFVGIGQTTPLHKLEVKDGEFAVRQTNSSASPGVKVINDVALQAYLRGAGTTRTNPGTAQGMPQLVSLSGYDLFISADGNNNIPFTTNRSERMRLTSDGKLSIGTSSPSAKLQVTTASSGVTPNANADELFIENNGAAGITIGSGANEKGNIFFADSGNALDGYIQYAHDTRYLRFATAGLERLRIDSSGNVGIGTTTPSSFNSLADNLVVGTTSGENGITIASGTGNSGRFVFSDNTTSSAAAFVGAIEYAHSSDAMFFYTSGSQRMAINSSGNVGIGTSSPSATLHIAGNSSATTEFKVGNSSWNASNSNAGLLHRYASSTGYSELQINSVATSPSSAFTVRNSTGIAMNFTNDGASTFNGKLTVNDTIKTQTISNRTSLQGVNPTPNDSNSFELGAGYLNLYRDDTVTVKQVLFGKNGSEVGNITTTGSTTAYNTSSDYRLKENVVDLTNATERLKQLKPKRFNFISNADTTVDGFIAHEVSSVVPEAVTGTHNEVKTWKEYEELPEGVSVGDNKLDENGNTIPEYQGIDQAKLVPLLVKTIQELEARITTLENA